MSCSSLLIHEQKFRRNRGDDQALRTYDERPGGRYRGRGNYRGRSRGRGVQMYSRATVECFKCHKLGHFQNECPGLYKEANYAALNQEEEMLLMAEISADFAEHECPVFADLSPFLVELECPGFADLSPVLTELECPGLADRN